ncbi:MAG: hypothetical protein M3384_12070 [Acidobacteriota bacterium]|nr:hypothetical protein [Acidobacteriota bacterium]
MRRLFQYSKTETNVPTGFYEHFLPMLKAPIVLFADAALKWQTKSPDREEGKAVGAGSNFKFPFEVKLFKATV